MTCNRAAFLTFLLLAPVALFADEAVSKSVEVDHSSPQSVFEAFADSSSNGDPATAFETMSPTMQSWMMFEIVFQQGMIENEELQTVIDKYFDKEKFKKLVARHKREGKTSDRESIDIIAASISDRRRFFIETSTILEKLQPPLHSISDLKEVVVQGKHAKGVATYTWVSVSIEKTQGFEEVRKEKEVKSEQEVLFIKLKDQWRVAAPWELEGVVWGDETKEKPVDSTNDNPKKQAKKKQPPFQWVNKLPKYTQPGVKHATFISPSMKTEVGYCIYTPPGYDAAKNAKRRYPVIYYLHGGRPGNENKGVKLAAAIHTAMSNGDVEPMIYVFVNGGPVSHYNLPDRTNAMGEDVFVNELIPHIDKTYRTIAERDGRALEGFSQGGRGTTRIMFRRPELFCSAAPGGSGYATEKRISENDGEESLQLVFAKGYNAWDLARAYQSEKQGRYPLKILVHVGTKGFNYENNLEYMKFLESLEIPFDRLIVPDAPHSAQVIYEKQGLRLMKFHAANLAHQQSDSTDSAESPQ